VVVGSAQVIRQGGNVIQVYMTVAIVSGPEGRMFHICAEVSVFLPALHCCDRSDTQTYRNLIPFCGRIMLKWILEEVVCKYTTKMRRGSYVYMLSPGTDRSSQFYSVGASAKGLVWQ
jgi:hypothetical protein